MIMKKVKYSIFFAALLIGVVAAAGIPDGWVDDKPHTTQMTEAQMMRERALRQACPNDCSNHGRCITSTGSCACVSGWGGVDCSVADTELTTGRPVSNTVSQRDFQYYHISLRQSATLNFTVTQSSSSQDCDLYVKRGSYPSRYDYTWRDISTEQIFSVVIDDADSGMYYAGVYGFTTCQYQIVADAGSICPDDCSGHGTCRPDGVCDCESGWSGESCETGVIHVEAGQPISATVGLREWVYFSFTNERQEDLFFKVDQASASADADMYVKFGSMPSFFNYDYRDDSVEQHFEIQVTEPTTGEWYIGVFGFSAADFTLTVEQQANCPNQCSGSSHGNCVSNGCSCNPGFSGSYCETKDQAMVRDQSYQGFVEQNAWNYYNFVAEVAENVNITVHQQQEGADCDLYLRAGEVPTRFSFDYRDVSLKNDFSVVVENPATAPVWYIGVYGYKECTYSISGHTSTSCPNGCSGHGDCSSDGHCMCHEGYSGEDCSDTLTELQSAVPVQGSVLQGEWQYYRVSNVQSTVAVHVAETDSQGFLWLYASADDYPTLRAHDWASTESNTAYHTISLERSDQYDPTTLVVGVYGNPYAPDCTTDSCRVQFEITAFAPPF